MNVLGVILARGGSIGLKDKHLRPLLGQPVLQYTIDHAMSAQTIDRIVLSSDSPEILKLGKKNGIETIERPDALATSDASVQDVMLHAMETVESRSDFRADALVVLYGNVAVRPPGVIDRAVELLESSGCDTVRSVVSVGKWHPTWMMKLNGDVLELLTPNSVHRRQDLQGLYLHEGGVVAVSRASMERAYQFPADAHAFFGVDRRGILTQPDETVEIDHLRDLYWAEAVLRERMETGKTWKVA
jgi:CMP-N-acetylneuraminic acid synthetase